MGFSLPKLEIPKLALPDINAELNKLTATYDPSASVNQVSSNLKSQQLSIEAVRANLESIRKQTQLETANADFNTLKSYTSGLQGQVDTACVMASVKPAFSPLTPDSLSNPLASNALASTNGMLTGDDLTDTLIANTGNLVAVAEQAGFVPSGMGNTLSNVVTGNVSSIASPENLTDMAVMGASIYASGLTGGVIPPSVCSTVIQGVAGNAVQGAIAGAMSGDVNATLQAAQSINTQIDTTALVQDIATDYSGGMMGNVVESAIAQSTSSLPASSDVSSATIANMGASVLTTINPTGYTGCVGGINYADPTPIITGMEINALIRASEDGDVLRIIDHSVALLKTQLVPPSIIVPMVDAAATNIQQTPHNIEVYQEFHNTLCETANTTPDHDSMAAAGGLMAEKMLGVDEARKSKAVSGITKHLLNRPKTLSALT